MKPLDQINNEIASLTPEQIEKINAKAKEQDDLARKEKAIIWTNAELFPNKNK